MRTENEICVPEALKTQMQSYFNSHWNSRMAATSHTYSALQVNSMDHPLHCRKQYNQHQKHDSLQGQWHAYELYYIIRVYCTQLLNEHIVFANKPDRVYKLMVNLTYLL